MTQQKDATAVQPWIVAQNCKGTNFLYQQIEIKRRNNINNIESYSTVWRDSSWILQIDIIVILHLLNMSLVY